MKYSVAGATELKRDSNSHFIRDRILLLILQELCVNPSYDYRYDPKQKRNLQWRTRLHLVTESWSSSSSSWSPFDEPKCRTKIHRKLEKASKIWDENRRFKKWAPGRELLDQKSPFLERRSCFCYCCWETTRDAKIRRAFHRSGEVL